jgi:hypothetical protein
VVVQGDVDLVLLAQLVQLVEVFEGRLRDERLDAHVLGELEGRLVGGADAEVHQLQALVGQALLDLLASLRRQPGADLLVGPVGAELLAGVGLDEVQAERGGVVHGLVEGAAVERPGLAAQPPAQLVGVRRPLGLVGGRGPEVLARQHPGRHHARGLEKRPAVHRLLLGQGHRSAGRTLR